MSPAGAATPNGASWAGIVAPHRAPALDPETCEQIRHLVEQGMTRQGIARRLGRPHTQVSKAVREMGGVEAIRREAEERSQRRQEMRDAEIATLWRLGGGTGTV
ncbi:MAG: hypothetical protein OXC14_15540 [Rhodospirillaceae bacterium]|nr:hypothetical protein [Rhodospirillaceae bacterium]